MLSSFSYGKVKAYLLSRGYREGVEVFEVNPAYSSVIGRRTEGNQRRYDVDSYIGLSKPTVTVCYCRVSSKKQSADLDRQIAFMRERYLEAEIVSDVGSSLNFKRRGLLSILERAHAGDKLCVVVAYRDSLARFGTELIETLLERNGGELVVLNQRDLSPE